MYDENEPMRLEFYRHVLHMSVIHSQVSLDFHGELRLPSQSLDVKVQGCRVYAYSNPAPKPGVIIYPWGDGSASAAPYEDGANVLVEVEHVPYVKADFDHHKRSINIWSVNSSGQLVRWE